MAEVISSGLQSKGEKGSEERKMADGGGKYLDEGSYDNNEGDDVPSNLINIFTYDVIEVKNINLLHYSIEYFRIIHCLIKGQLIVGEDNNNKTCEVFYFILFVFYIIFTFPFYTGSRHCRR